MSEDTSRPRPITILGSTGSVGSSALSVISEAGKPFKVEGLAAGRNWQKLAKQAITHKAVAVAIHDEAAYHSLKDALAHTDIIVSAGEEAVCEIASRPCDTVIAAIVGAIGIPSALAAINAGNRLALANKESMVCASAPLKIAAKNNGIKILPLDSEHNAVFQAMQNGRGLQSITITASGGPFINTPIETLKDISVEEATTHPKWSMGPKISVDSATMMNKALEFAEAVYLFDLPQSKVDVVVHPQAILHGMAHFVDGTTLAHMSNPDMRVPIAHAMGYPDRIPLSVPKLSLAEIGRLEFFEVNQTKFPAINLMRSALEQGQGAPIVLNAANEVAVDSFLRKRCGFLDIIPTISHTLEQFNFTETPQTADCGFTLSEISSIDRAARDISVQFLSGKTPA